VIRRVGSPRKKYKQNEEVVWFEINKKANKIWGVE